MSVQYSKSELVEEYPNIEGRVEERLQMWACPECGHRDGTLAETGHLCHRPTKTYFDGTVKVRCNDCNVTDEVEMHI
jgi:hypothetical protein